ncbi:MAG: metalloregulator ArsR/SmtB family transcription factor [Pseudomonadales bacterium]|nr:metalloregulator ArsR/SmtB family transcription factor [Pseudomonadales bacterium]
MDIFKAISDDKRRAIISLLVTQGPLTFSAISMHCHASRQATSKHLMVLNQAKLIDIEKKGRQKVCRANLSRLNEVIEWAEFHHTLWEQKLDSLQTFLNGK